MAERNGLPRRGERKQRKAEPPEQLLRRRAAPPRQGEPGCEEERDECGGEREQRPCDLWRPTGPVRADHRRGFPRTHERQVVEVASAEPSLVRGYARAL